METSVIVKDRDTDCSWLILPTTGVISIASGRLPARRCWYGTTDWRLGSGILATAPHVTDTNNATDGDLLIAYGLALAGSAWHRPDLTASATNIATALADGGLETVGDLVLLKPGNAGFGAGDRADGPVVNPSYWVFEALPVLAELVPDGPWRELADNGKALLVRSMKIGPSNLPPDWVSLKAKPRPADGFPSGIQLQRRPHPALPCPLGQVATGHCWSHSWPRCRIQTGAYASSISRQGKPGNCLPTMATASFPRSCPACSTDSRLAPNCRSFTPTEYYPSTLQLLALSYARRHHRECL